MEVKWYKGMTASTLIIMKDAYIIGRLILTLTFAQLHKTWLIATEVQKTVLKRYNFSVLVELLGPW